MKRTERYPETRTYRYYNANPKNRITADCAARAISTATGISYSDVVKGLADVQIRTGYEATEGKGLDIYMESIGWVKNRQPRKEDGTKYTGAEFCQLLSQAVGHGSVIANIGGHHMVSIMRTDDHGRFKVHDTWDSTDGCIGNYWMKKN